MRIIEPSAVLVWITPNADAVIEAAGRVCYKSEDKTTEDSSFQFIRKIIERGHEAVLEHASASFRIVTDRGITHEIVRHRLASYCQESTRYCNYADDKFAQEITVIRPCPLMTQPSIAWVKGCEAAEAAYFEMLDAGASPQIARSVLPTCTKAEIIMTCNFREWRHFLKMRMPPSAHPSMRPLALQIAGVLNDLCPAVFHADDIIGWRKGRLPE